ncbi:hypothetical protein ACSL103130_05905 [Actinomyces slackii]|uniref:Uncharacterized protein n=1 Tax=Actinomyces slackii TaxID=52774 RepID=A0A448KE28_9ACTO|nr:hypothetical protein [Actinomyces slackii]VEG75186.1 Uncharacterised protein [Actinomyces slackii]
MVPLLSHVLSMSGTSLTQAVAQGSLLLTDGTPISASNRPGNGNAMTKSNYSGEHHAPCLSVQAL